MIPTPDRIEKSGLAAYMSWASILNFPGLAPLIFNFRNLLMPLLSLRQASLNFDGKPVLDEVDFSIEPGERVCLTGRNAAGKSCLMSILSGDLKPDSGLLTGDPLLFGSMPQAVPESWSGSILSLVAAGLASTESALDVPALALSDQDQPGGPSWDHYSRVLGVIKRLKLDPEAEFRTLSGGGKRRVALARALVRSSDLILDEPTNHLDMETIVWLEDFLLRRARTLVFVSHDRAFVRRLASRVVEVDRGRLYSYACGFDEYLSRREERLAAEERHFALFDKKLAQEEVWIRQGVKERRTRNMGRVKALIKMRAERAARRDVQGKAALYVQEAERSGQLVIRADNISFAYPGQGPLFSGFSTLIQRGDRVGLVGANGSGKSTLLKVLLAELAPSEGSIRHGRRLEVAYFDQLRQSLDPEASLMDSVANGNDVVTIGANTRHVAGYLQDFLFAPDRLRLPVKVLSGGERNRLLLAKLFARPSNLLVLDEPTNDLDVETLELLEEMLLEYSGTVILVSHDRHLLDNVATSVLALEGDGLVHEYVGAYTDWLRQRKAPETPGVSDKARPLAAPSDQGEGGQAAATATLPRKKTFNEQREFDLLALELEELPDRLSALEDEQAALEERLADPAFFGQDAAAFNQAAKRLSELEQEQIELFRKWEETERRFEELKALR